jgi:acid stress-induced BolA-like protein IbaG/YrbA
MSDHPTDFVGSIEDAITSSIKERMPDASVEVSGGGGHWRIGVVSSAFAGKSILEQQRLVLAAIKHLINGANAPVHAVDALTTRTP